MNPPSLRIHSIDVLRALTMVLMIFVNDLWSLKNIPQWLGHTEAMEDGMGLADTVFPAFLFIVGMSIPFSVHNRRIKGENKESIAWHILTRSIALLVMGLFLVNGEYINKEATGLQPVVWNSLCCFSFILVWNVYPKKVKPWMVRIAKTIGIVMLFILALNYRGGTEKIHGFQTYWWGILGLIGWAYLAAAIIYNFGGSNFYIPVISWLFFMVLCIAHHAGWLPDNNVINTLASPIGYGSMPAFTMGGILISMIFISFGSEKGHSKMMILLLAISIVLFVLGFYTRTYWGISKIRATPAWVLICSAITIIAFIMLHWMVDMKNKIHWFDFIKPAGNNTLLCYLLPYFAYAFVVLLGLSLPLFLLTGMIGLIKSLAFALLIVALAGILGKWGIRLKL